MIHGKERKKDEMLQKLTIKNFQAHKKLEIDLDQYVTTIIGPSDVGKSAIIRALLWLASNRPSGYSFIKEGTKATTVVLKVDDQEIHRHRSKSVNSYELRGNGFVDEFKAFGNDVPTNIYELLNLSEVNFQQQHDSPFWFCETAGEVSRQLNQIVNLDIIDSTLSNLDKAGREARTKIKVIEQQLENAKNTRASLKWAKTAEKDLEGVEEGARGRDLAANRQRGISDLVTDVLDYGENLEGLRGAVKSVEEVIQQGDEWSNTHTRFAALNTMLNVIREQQEIIQRPIPDIEPLIELKNTIREIEEQAKNLEDGINNVLTAKRKVHTTTTEVQRAEDEFEEEMGDVCPLCERKL